MKVDKIKIPLEPQFEDNYRPSDEDVAYMQNLVKQNKIKEFEDFVNSKMVGRELSTNFPGIPTRDYLASALSKSIENRYPKLGSMSRNEQFQFLKDKVYPGLDDLKSKFGLSNETDIDHFNQDSYIPYGKKDAGKIELDSNSSEFIDSALHEIAHSVDDPIKQLKKSLQDPFSRSTDATEIKRKALEDFSLRNPKVQKLVNNDITYTTNTEDLSKYKNITRTPNFEDYNWKSGEFKSDTIGNPIDKYKQVGGEHHINRPFSLDNFINFNKGDLKDIVETKEISPKFQKIKKIIA